jgi:hypothetical protein
LQCENWFQNRLAQSDPCDAVLGMQKAFKLKVGIRRFVL